MCFCFGLYLYELLSSYRSCVRCSFFFVRSCRVFVSLFVLCSLFVHWLRFVFVICLCSCFVFFRLIVFVLFCCVVLLCQFRCSFVVRFMFRCCPRFLIYVFVLLISCFTLAVFPLFPCFVFLFVFISCVSCCVCLVWFWSCFHLFFGGVFLFLVICSCLMFSWFCL